jgi:hypothetical protein
MTKKTQRLKFTYPLIDVLLLLVLEIEDELNIFLLSDVVLKISLLSVVEGLIY